MTAPDGTRLLPARGRRCPRAGTSVRRRRARPGRGRGPARPAAGAWPGDRGHAGAGRVRRPPGPVRAGAGPALRVLGRDAGPDGDVWTVLAMGQAGPPGQLQGPPPVSRCCAHIFAGHRQPVDARDHLLRNYKLPRVHACARIPLQPDGSVPSRRASSVRVLCDAETFSSSTWPRR